MDMLKIYYGILIDQHNLIEDEKIDLKIVNQILSSILPPNKLIEYGCHICNDDQLIIYLNRLSDSGDVYCIEDEIHHGKYEYVATLSEQMTSKISLIPSTIDNMMIKSILGELYKYNVITTVGYHCVSYI